MAISGEAQHDPTQEGTARRVRAGPRAPWRMLALLSMLLLVWVLGNWGYRVAHQGALRTLEARGENTLHLAEAALRGQIQRFDRLPGLIAQSPEIHALMFDAGNPEQVLQANIHLRELVKRVQASDIYVMALDGTTIAASNFDLPHSFVGGNFAFRPYFRDVFTSGEGRFYALGTTSLVRGYYFGAPVMIDDAIEAVLVVKIDVDAIEQGWRGSDYEVIVTDPEEVVFMSSHPDWTFGAMRPLDNERRARTLATRRYADVTPHDLAFVARAGPGGERLWRYDGAGGARDYLVLSQPMPDADWTVHVLVDTAEAHRQALALVMLAGLALGLAGLVAVIVAQRRARLAERLALQAQAQAELECRVAARTSELARVNRQLQDEIGERRAAEQRLRDTQAELVQAGKLAALGQMSAALGHEFNQPLGAARNFAENAGAFIERGRIDEARGNIGRILALIDRMSAISRNLRNFARKPLARLRDVPLVEALAAARDILDWRLRAQAIELVVDLGPDPPVLRAGPVRLQQVLVNILGNAIDALEGSEGGQILLTARCAGGMAEISIADNGPGIADGVIGRVFDPFFSSKGVGRGLGLGLSISYNIVHDFAGTLRAANRSGGGAVFTMSLPLAEAAAPRPQPA